MQQMTYGNGLTATEVRNKRLQPCRGNVNNSGTVLHNCSDPTPSSGNIQDFNYGFNSGSANNGNVVSMTASGNQSFNRSYSYDNLNRLASMSAPGDACNGLTWTYDAWGDRTDQTVTGGTCNTFHNPATTKNQLSGSPYVYDAAGNLINDGNHTYTYDAENRIITVDNGATTYNFDAQGHRVTKTTSVGWRNYLYDTAGRAVAETTSPGWQVGYGYLGAQLLTQYRDSTTYFYQQDHLGSTRLMTALNQNVYDSMDYLPYGEQIAGATGSSHKFTDKERDTETGLDYFGARYYESPVGRFASPDPHNPVSQSNNKQAFDQFLHDPSRWNRYAYVSGNPLIYVDPDGREKRLVIYVQQPQPGKPTAWVRDGFGANTGHSFIGLKDTDTHQEMKRGFYPAETTIPGINPSVKGIVKDDANHPWNVSKEYTITDKQYNQLKKSIQKDEKNPPTYDVNQNNCTDWVQQKSSEVGIDLPHTHADWPGGGGTNPGQLGQELKKQGGQDNPDAQKASGSSSGSS